MRVRLIDRPTRLGVLGAPGFVAVVVACVCLLLAVVAPGVAGASFGIESFDGSFTNQDGSPATQAGSHPYEMTTSIDFNVNPVPNSTGHLVAEGNAKDVAVNVPAGVVGDPLAAPTCTDQQLLTSGNGFGSCPASSQIGQVTVRLSFLGEVTVPLSNMVAPPGEPAQFGAYIVEAPIYIDPHLRTGGDYGLTTTSSDISTLEPFSSVKVTLWGVPGDPSHDAMRGALCLGDPSNPANCFLGGFSTNASVRPFLTLPTSCGGPQTTTMSTDSWQEPGDFLTASFLTHDGSGAAIGFDGCDRLPFGPSLSVAPETSAADTPTGLQVDVHMPLAGLQDPEGLAEANLKRAVVALPAGLSVNPAIANGLAACSPAQIALSGPEPVRCPDAAKIGSVEVDTPILDHPLEGGVYVAEQGNNPFGSLLAIYIAVSDPETGIVIKLAGHVVADPQTGQLTTTFDDVPQQPFSDLKLDFFGGPRAALVTPDACGSYGVSSQFTPWSSETPVEPSAGFEVSSGCHGPQFAPSFAAGTLNPQAGAFSPLSVSFARSDQDQALGGITLTTPPGLLGILKGVERCPEPQAAQGTCGAGSLIGHTTASAGAGPDPVSITGEVFLTGPYKGAPFGLSIVVPAVAGPFNLGTVVVRAAVNIDPHTAQITVTSDPLPSILQGIPLRIRSVNVTIDRSGFTFNPTDCEPLVVSGTLSSTQGASVGVFESFPGRELREPRVQTVLLGLNAGRDEQEERREPPSQGRIPRGGGQHPLGCGDTAQAAPRETHDDPAGMHRSRVQRQPRQLPSRREHRDRHSEHTDPRRPAHRPGVLGVARRCGVPRHRRDPPGRRRHCRPHRQHRHQARHHQLDIR